jgi:hypothetical protein
VKISSLLSLFLLSPPLFTRAHPFQTASHPSSPSFHLSLPPWKCEDSTKGKTQDWKQKDLLRPLFTFPFEFFGFISSSSLQRYSNLLFA